MAAKEGLTVPDDELDLNPLIDVITMLIIFFILGGKMSQDVRTEAITVPPTKTATKLDDNGMKRIIINVFGNTQTLTGVPETRMRVGTKEFVNKGNDGEEAYKGYSQLRSLLDAAYDIADREPDPKGTGISLPKIVLEIRADADTQYRVIQEIQQVVTDTIDPNNGMQAKAIDPKTMKAFVNINFTSRIPGRE
jgi:biopolymer transport protein ExbD